MSKPSQKAGQGGEPQRTYLQQWREAWNRFWFTPRQPVTLGVMRILVGLMLLYTHLVWSLELQTFFGAADSSLPSTYRGLTSPGTSYLWSHFDWLGGAMLWPAHLFALIIFALFTIGAFTRVTGLLSALLVISYANRATGAQFGLDQINGFLAIYLAIGPSGQWASFDRWWRAKKGQGGAIEKSTMANVTIRLMQVHLCIVYLFAGMGKLQGSTWWNGEAIWGSLANYEYQTINMVWLADYMWLVNLLTLGALAWEVAYPFLIWPRLTRPIFLTMAVLVHLGIGLCMGMMTFGLIMIIANLAFVDSDWIRATLGRFGIRFENHDERLESRELPTGKE